MFANTVTNVYLLVDGGAWIGSVLCLFLLLPLSAPASPSPCRYHILFTPHPNTHTHTPFPFALPHRAFVCSITAHPVHDSRY